MPVRLTFVLMSLGSTLPLLAGCPGDDTGDGDTTTASDTTTTASDTTTTASDTTTTASDTTDGNDDTTDGGGLPGCACIVDETPADENSPPLAPTCGESSCPLVSGGCADSYCDRGIPFVLDDPAALECALTALRDRTPGVVTWSFSEASGVLDEDGYVLVNEDGTAVHRSWTREDLNFEVSDAVLGELPAPEAFDACLAETDDRTRFDCLRATLGTSLGVCDEGWICWECI